MPFDPDPAAALIAEARRGLRALEGLPSPTRPGSIAEGYAVQERVSEAAGPRAGWKIAYTSPAMRASVGLAEPVAGRVPAAVVWVSPFRVAPSSFRAPAVEAEFAVRLGGALPPDPAPDPARVRAAVAEVMPAVEIVDPPFVDRRAAGVASVVAAGSAAGLVLGQAIADWWDLELRALAVSVEFDGVAAARGSGAEVMGDPWAALLWLVAHLGSRGIGLSAGEVVTTGTCTGLTPVPPGAKVVARHGDFPTVEVEFA